MEKSAVQPISVVSVAVHICILFRVLVITGTVKATCMCQLQHLGVLNQFLAKANGHVGGIPT